MGLSFRCSVTYSWELFRFRSPKRPSIFSELARRWINVSRDENATRLRGSRIYPVSYHGAMAVAHSHRPAGRAGFLAIAAFAVVYLVGAVYWPRPLWVVGLYLVNSLICFALYATDKRRATFGGWRISERTSLFWGFIGGWPGAIVAQQILRHKTRKRSFREAFWITVVVNVLLFALLSTPTFDRLVAQAITDFSSL